MNTVIRKGLLAAAICIACLAVVLPVALSQEKPRGLVVVYPIVYSRNSGTTSGRKTGVTAIKETVQKAGYTLISGTVAANTWRRMGVAFPTTDKPAPLKELTRLGKALKARYVISVDLDFHSRSIWVDLGPKTISTATVDVVIADVKQNKIVYTRDDVSARSDEKFDIVKAGADVLISPLVSIVSGGPKAPHEQRAVQIAVAKALRDWVKPV